MAETKKYLDLIGLGVYDAKIKALIDDKENAGVAATKVKELADGQVATNKAAIAKNAEDIAANAAAIAQIQENAYDDTELRGLINANESAINGIAADYLKAADKTDLQDKITAEADARKAADDALDGRLDKVEVFFETVEGETLDASLDTLIEIQKFITSEGEAADQMVKDIAANKTAIETEVTNRTNADTALGERLDVLEAIDHDAYKAADTALKTELTTAIDTKAAQSAVDEMDSAYKAADTALGNRITALEGAVGESGSVASDIADAKAEAISTAAADATTKANQALADAKAYADAEDAKIESRVDALETASHSHDNKTILDGITAAKVEAWDGVENKAAQADLEAETNRAKAAEETNAAAIAAFTAITSDEITALFTA